MDIVALAAELVSGHPDTLAYNADATIAAAEINAVNRTRNLASISGDAMRAATDGAEFIALSDHKQVLWISLCSGASIDPFGTANVALVNHIFSLGPTTVAALAALRTEAVSRAVELGLGPVRVGHILTARGEV